MDSHSATAVHVGVGIDTARYGHHVTFLSEQRQDVGKDFMFMESRSGYRELEAALRSLAETHAGAIHFEVRIDAAGQYATNLEAFLRTVDLPMTISVGEPKRNRDYKNAHYPKRKADTVDSRAQARFAVVERPVASAVISAPMRHLAEVANRLSAQRKQTTRFINQLHNLLARVFPELATLVPNVAAQWVLEMLRRFPSAKRIAAARTLSKIAYLNEPCLERIQRAARTTVASLDGAVAETLVKQAVENVRHSQRLEGTLETLLEHAFEALGEGAHRQLLTIPGIGKRTAAALVAKIVSIERFPTPEQLVSYFGAFPEEHTSGVDTRGNPVPVGTMHMSAKGNDLVRGYLWMACQSAIVCNPALRPLYRRQRAMGKRGDVALGHCMKKMLHLVFALWKTNHPFDPEHYPWDGTRQSAEPPAAASVLTEPVPLGALPNGGAQAQRAATNELATRCSPRLPDTPGTAQPSEATTPDQPVPRLRTEQTPSPQTKAAGRKEALPPERKAVTAATNELATPTLPPDREPGNPRTFTPGNEAPRQPPGNVWVDFAHVRSQITIEQILSKLGVLDRLRGRGPQRRGPCPIHGSQGNGDRPFSVHLEKNAFRCLHTACAQQGNALDLWAAARHLPLREAAIDLAAEFRLRLAPTLAPPRGKR